MSERPEEAIAWIRTESLKKSDDWKVQWTRDLVNYITRLEAELEQAKAEKSWFKADSKRLGEIEKGTEHRRSRRSRCSF